MKLESAKKIAEELAELLRPACLAIEIAGSIRRRKSDVGDIELLCIPGLTGFYDLLDEKLKWLISTGVLEYRLNKKGSIVYGPKNKLLRHVDSGIGVDVFSTTEECWPVALVVRTGGEATNKMIASLAIERGMRWHVYGRGFTLADGSELICHSEEDVFKAVGLRFLEPWERK